MLLPTVHLAGMGKYPAIYGAQHKRNRLSYNVHTVWLDKGARIMVAPESVGHLFEGKAPQVRELYQHLLNALSAVGDVRVAPKQTSIHLENNKAFAGIHPRKNY